MLRQLKNARAALAGLRFLKSAPLRYAFDAVTVAGLALLLCIWLNFREPLRVPPETKYLLALEVPFAFGLMALARQAGLRLRWWFFAIIAVLAVLLRLFVTADNISHRFLYRDFRIPLDLHLVPEFFRLMYDTSPARAVASYLALFVGFIVVSLALVSLTLAYVHVASDRPSLRRVIVAFAVLCAGIVGFQEFAKPQTALYSREFSYRIGKEARNIWKLPQDRERIVKQIKAVGARIGEGVHLDKLEGNNVLFIFVESYGRTALVHPAHRELLLPRYKEMERNLQAEGFHVASDFVTSPTYGGFSWFAHMTVNTGVKVISHLHSQLLDEQDPISLADHFRDAGYLPVIVAPGATRPWPGMEDHYGFRNHYYAWEFGYRGPRYGWPTMADQFVLDHIQRNVLANARQPVFVQAALVSSHAPFNDIPRYVEDWSQLGDGSILHKTGRDRFEVSWNNTEQIAQGYSAAIKYDLRVIEGFLMNYIKDDTLVIFMGDHQPNQQVTGSDHLTWSVPSHVACRNPAFIEPFLRRGYLRGMVPDQPLPHVGMERFMEEFLSDFSSKPLAVDPGIWPPIRERLEARSGEAAEKARAAAAGAHLR